MTFFSNASEPPVKPLVADSRFVELQNSGILDASFQTSDWLRTLGEFISNKSTVQEAGHDLVSAQLRAFLAPNQPFINVPINQTYRLLSLFYPCVADLDVCQSNLKELALAKYVVLLQLQASPECDMNLRNEESTLIGGCLSPRQFDLETLYLTFSYGYSFERYCADIKLQLKKQIFSPKNPGSESDKQQEFGQVVADVSRFLASNTHGATVQAHAQEKEKFASKYHLHRDVLDVAKDNPYFHVFGYLRDAYRNYHQKDFDKAAAQYQTAGTLLESFDAVSEVIKSDYQYRLETAVQYRTFCRTRYNCGNESSDNDIAGCVLTGTAGSYFQTLVNTFSSPQDGVHCKRD